MGTSPVALHLWLHGSRKEPSKEDGTRLRDLFSQICVCVDLTNSCIVIINKHSELFLQSVLVLNQVQSAAVGAHPGSGLSGQQYQPTIGQQPLGHSVPSHCWSFAISTSWAVVAAKGRLMVD